MAIKDSRSKISPESGRFGPHILSYIRTHTKIMFKIFVTVFFMLPSPQNRRKVK